MSVRVRRTNYGNRAALAVYMSDKTSHVRETIASMKYKEQVQRSQNDAKYQSSVSHEMRTPLLTMIFFLEQIANLLNMHKIPTNMLPEARKWCKLMMSSLTFC